MKIRTKAMIRAELRGHLLRTGVGQTVDHVLNKFDAAWSGSRDVIRRMAPGGLADALRSSYSGFKNDKHPLKK
jgi:hypothetical protein